MSRLTALQYAKRYIDKEKFDEVKVVATRLFKKGYTVEEIAFSYNISNLETVAYISRLAIGDVLTLYCSGWSLYTIALQGYALEDAEILGWWRNLQSGVQ